MTQSFDSTTNIIGISCLSFRHYKSWLNSLLNLFDAFTPVPGIKTATNSVVELEPPAPSTSLSQSPQLVLRVFFDKWFWICLHQTPTPSPTHPLLVTWGSWLKPHPHPFHPLIEPSSYWCLSSGLGNWVSVTPTMSPSFQPSPFMFWPLLRHCQAVRIMPPLSSFWDK